MTGIGLSLPKIPPQEAEDQTHPPFRLIFRRYMTFFALDKEKREAFLRAQKNVAEQYTTKGASPTTFLCSPSRRRRRSIYRPVICSRGVHFYSSSIILQSCSIPNSLLISTILTIVAILNTLLNSINLFIILSLFIFSSFPL
jgi:hypothetical protein